MMGHYICTACGSALFDSKKKFEANCGFPSFWDSLGAPVKETVLTTYKRTRTQLLCNSCGQHLGHLFDNKMTPTGKRYCIVREAIKPG